MGLTFKRFSGFNDTILTNLKIVLSDPNCIKLKRNVSCQFKALYQTQHSVLLFLVEYGLLDYEYCVKFGGLLDAIKFLPRDYKHNDVTEKFMPLWLWIVNTTTNENLKLKMEQLISNNKSI